LEDTATLKNAYAAITFSGSGTNRYGMLLVDEVCDDGLEKVCDKEATVATMRYTQFKM